MDAQEYVEKLSNDDLEQKLDEAKSDLEKAANEQPESEWHQACFAAVLVLAFEMTRRLNRNRLH